MFSRISAGKNRQERVDAVN